MRIFRIEHASGICDDPVRQHRHGMHAANCSKIWNEDVPMFGSIGPCPSSDFAVYGYKAKGTSDTVADDGTRQKTIGIKSHQSCGVLETQFDLWWSNGYRQLFPNAGWRVVEFEVPQRHPHLIVGEWQVVFNREEAQIVGVSTDVHRFIGKHKLPVLGRKATVWPSL